MAKANPTLFGGKRIPKKGAMIHGAGDHYKFIRCPKCGAKYLEEENKVCPICCGKGIVLSDEQNNTK